MKIRQIWHQEEFKIRKWLLAYDPAFAVHHQLKSYFLALTDKFGIMTAVDDNDKYLACALYSRDKEESYIHQYYGPIDYLNEISSEIGIPCVAFIRSEVTNVHWNKVMDITPGMMKPHKAFDTVFSRSVPRFKGAIYERVD